VERALVVRTRLLDRLRDRWFTPVTVLTAPAGYGKTTLLAQALAANHGAPLGEDCWLACAPGDTTASALGEGLLAAVDAPSEGTAASAGGLARVVTEALWHRSPDQVALVVDDVHEIPAGSEAAALLAAVVASLPANAHVVLSGRAPPPVPLARLELAGAVAHLGDADLAFTDEEAAEFAARAGVPGADVAGWGGWPALAALSARARPGVAADYVGQEVLAGMAPDRRRDLALLAAVGTVDDRLARSALGRADADLDALVAGLPLVTRGPGDERTLHALWRRLVADAADPADVDAARRRAAADLEARGRTAASARLLIDARAWDQLGDAIVGALGATHPPVPRDVLAEWLDVLPADSRQAPSGQLLAAAVSAEPDPVAAAPRLEAAAAAFRAAGDETGELASLVQLAQLAWWSEDLVRLAGLAGRVFELEAGGCADAVPLACLGRALMHDAQNDMPAVLAELDRVPAGTLNEVWQGIVDWIRSISFMQLGDARAALAAADDAAEHAGPLQRPLAEGARLQARWYLGEVEDVRPALPAVVDAMAAAGYHNYTALAAAQCALADATAGHPGPAAAQVARARAAAVLPLVPLVDTHLTVAEGAVAVAAGDEARAAAVLADGIERHPLGAGHSLAVQQRGLALFYVLVPATRPAWDAAPLGPAPALARDLARAVVAVRAGHRLPAGAPAIVDAVPVEAHLPLPWAATLGVAAVAAGRDDGWRLLDRLWPAARPQVSRLAAGAGGPGAPLPRLREAAAAVLARLAAPPAGRLELRLLGPVELRRDGVAVPAADWRRERVRSLLAYLALHGTVSRSHLADELWPALDAEAQSRNLRVTLTYLLRVLEPDRGARDASFFVRQHGGNLTLHPGDALTVDVWEFDRLTDAARAADRRGAPAEALDHARAAADLWRADPTELAGEAWALPQVEQRRERFAAAATRAGELLLARGRTDEARALAERALAADPWREGAHRLVVAAHRAAGDDLAARKALTRYREAITDLGIDPGEATLMVERLLDAGPARAIAARAGVRAGSGAGSGLAGR
jgi:LuxR family maltose regulon positive regulatory protein